MNALTWPSVITACMAGSLLAADTPAPPTPEQVQQAIARGTDFLIKSQNPNGSWGGARGSITTFTGPVWSNPETHRSWRVGTTGLCCMALMAVGESPQAMSALDRGIEYMIVNSVVKRPSDWDVDNTWAYIYGLHSLAVAYGHPHFVELRPKISPVIGKHLEKLAAYQALSGGWAYYEFSSPRKRRPEWSTSFSTAAAVIALQEARRQGFTVDDKMVARAVRGIKRCRLPSGAYTYSIQAIADPRHSEWIDQVKGSLSRIQVCHEALLQAGEDISQAALLTGIGHFFREHRFLDAARNRPIPHEAYYLNSGYFYLFGHYYASLVISRLPEADRQKYWPKLQYEVMKTQQKDGSMWDFEMHSYSKPYGIAFGLLTLKRSIAGAAPKANGSAPISSNSGD